MEWFLILKVLSRPTVRSQPAAWDYWRREADAHQAGTLDDLPGGLVAPRCWGISEQPEGECSIWLDVKDDVGPQWPLEHYASWSAMWDSSASPT
jgi:hypothetical protein